jgi:hypothetical protein
MKTLREFNTMQIIILFALIGIFLLLLSTGYLVWMNWSEQLYGPLFSVLLAATITLLLAVLATLKSTSEESKFPTSIVFDDAIHKPPIIFPDIGSTEAINRMNALGAVASQEKSTPNTLDEIFIYCGEIIQYKLLTDIRDLGRLGTGISQSVGSNTLRILSAEPIVKLQDQIELPPSQIKGYDLNRFADTQIAKFGWEMFGGVRVPEGTKIELKYIPSSKDTGPDKHVIQLTKKNYFDLEITISAFGGGAPGNLPPGISLQPDVAKHSTTYVYDINMRAQFEKLTAGNWRTEHYKKWVNWLMTQVQKRNRSD